MEQSTVGGGAGQAASALAERAQQASGAVQERAQEAAETAQSRMREEVDRRTTMAGDQVSAIAGAMRQSTQGLRDNGQDGPARMVETVADRADGLASYLRDVDADRLLHDVEDFGRRQPMLLAGGGVLVGLLAARFLKASSSGRYRAGQRRSSYGAWEQTLPSEAQLPDATRTAGTGSGTGLYGEPAVGGGLYGSAGTAGGTYGEPGPLPAPQPYPGV